MAVTQTIYQRPLTEPQYPLPEDAFRDEQGNLWRRMPVHKGFFDQNNKRLENHDAIMETWRTGGVVSEDHDEEPQPCMVPPPWATPDQVEEMRKEARAKPCHFWHPEQGWLNWGRKRAQEAPENLGTGAIQRNRRRTVLPPDQGAHYMATAGAPPPASEPTEAPVSVDHDTSPRSRRVAVPSREED
jgi:hypothetical protein